MDRSAQKQPRTFRFTSQNIDKVRLSIECFQSVSEMDFRGQKVRENRSPYSRFRAGMEVAFENEQPRK